jgi:hypothetical protein
VRPDVLGLLRILTNFEMDSRLVLSIVLAGQPPLGALLRHERLEDVAQRLNFCVTLRLLSRDETARYIEHRCAIAGAPTCPFAPETTEAISEAGRGNLRATDRARARRARTRRTARLRRRRRAARRRRQKEPRAVSSAVHLLRGVLLATEDTLGGEEQTMLVLHPDIEPRLEHVDTATRTLPDALAFAIARYRCEHSLTGQPHV